MPKRLRHRNRIWMKSGTLILQVNVHRLIHNGGRDFRPPLAAAVSAGCPPASGARVTSLTRCMLSISWSIIGYIRTCYFGIFRFRVPDPTGSFLSIFKRTSNYLLPTIEYDTKICSTHNVCQLAESEVRAVTHWWHMAGLNALYSSIKSNIWMKLIWMMVRCGYLEIVAFQTHGAA